MSVVERMKWIEACLRFVGYLPKKALMRRFDISPAQMSNDLRSFVSLQNDLGGKLSIRAGQIEGGLPVSPLEGLPHPTDLLAETGVAPFSSIDRMLRSRPDPEIFAQLIEACSKRHILRIIYHSLGSGRSERRISVNRFVEAAGRLHVRVYDHDKNRYADFVLARMEAVLGKETGISAVGLDEDEEFKTFIKVTLRVNPKLDKDQRFSVCQDYVLHPRHGRVLHVRKCDLIYLKAEYGEVSDDWLPPVVLQYAPRGRVP